MLLHINYYLTQTSPFFPKKTTNRVIKNKKPRKNFLR